MSVHLLVEHFADVDTWHGFTNSDEICISCAGSEGCKLGGKITIEKKNSIIIDHSNFLFSLYMYYPLLLITVDLFYAPCCFNISLVSTFLNTFLMHVFALSAAYLD